MPGTLAVQSCCGRRLGDDTNNVAEYRGLLDALEHAAANPSRNLEFRVDSKLLAEQASGRWRCRASNLLAMYERVLVWMSTLRNMVGVDCVEIVHVYREYNGETDGICNEILDMRPSTPDRYGFVINRGWRP